MNFTETAILLVSKYNCFLILHSTFIYRCTLFAILNFQIAIPSLLSCDSTSHTLLA